MMVRFSGPSLLINSKKGKRCQSWTLSDETFCIRAWARLLLTYLKRLKVFRQETENDILMVSYYYYYLSLFKEDSTFSVQR